MLTASNPSSLERLKLAREHLRKFLEGIASTENEQTFNYWKTQIAGTLIIYPSQLLVDLQDTLENSSSKSISPQVLTAYWAMKLLSGKKMAKTNSEVDVLYLALNKPGRIIPQQKHDEVVISGNDVTKSVRQLIRIVLLSFLVENEEVIAKFIQDKHNRRKKEYTILKDYNVTWLNQEIQQIEQMLEICPIIEQPLVKPKTIPVAPPPSAWTQFWGYYNQIPFLAGRNYFTKAPIDTNSPFSQVFFWVLLWSQLAWMGIIAKQQIWLPLQKSVHNLKQYLFHGSNEIPVESLTHNFLWQIAKLIFSPYLLLLPVYGILTLPLKALIIVKEKTVLLGQADQRRNDHPALIFFFNMLSVLFFVSISQMLLMGLKFIFNPALLLITNPIYLFAGLIFLAPILTISPFLLILGRTFLKLFPRFRAPEPIIINAFDDVDFDPAVWQAVIDEVVAAHENEQSFLVRNIRPLADPPNPPEEQLEEAQRAAPRRRRNAARH